MQQRHVAAEANALITVRTDVNTPAALSMPPDQGAGAVNLLDQLDQRRNAADAARQSLTTIVSRT